MTTLPDLPTGVLVMAHGTPSTPEQILPFYTRIRRGSPPPDELLTELTDRYRDIGGMSPLNEKTYAQVNGLSAALDAIAPGRYLVRYGTKYVQPMIEEAVGELIDAGVERIVGIVLTPHQSTMGSGEYFERATKAAEASGHEVEFVVVPSWYQADGLTPILAERTQAVLDSLDDEARGHVAVFFTAHSLPERVVAMGDTYPDQVRESGQDIAAALDLDGQEGVSWGTAWQSAGRTKDPWIGPDLLVEMERVASAGARAVVVCPVGFVSDHLEVLYDLDIEAKALADNLGIAFARTPSLNDDPQFLAVLAKVVHAADHAEQ